MNKRKTLYLAGPINACTDAEAKDWRQNLQAELSDQFHFLDPMRRDYRGLEAQSVDAIVEGDMQDVRDTDIFLAYTPKPSVGTSMEIFYASFVLGKQVLVVHEGDKPSPWLVKFSTKISRSWEEAIEWLRSQA